MFGINTFGQHPLCDLDGFVIAADLDPLFSADLDPLFFTDLDSFILQLTVILFPLQFGIVQELLYVICQDITP